MYAHVVEEMYGCDGAAVRVVPRFAIVDPLLEQLAFAVFAVIAALRDSSAESAPRGLISSAIGIVVGAGEIFGGGVAPYIAGSIADTYGLPNVLWVAFAGVALGIIICAFFKETAPKKVPALAAPAA